jgi:hypothetical protein
MTKSNHEMSGDDDPLRSAELFLGRWKRRALILGALLATCVISTIPFLAGHSLHQYAEPTARILIWMSMILLPLFLGSAALTFNGWLYRRNVKKVLNKYGSDLNK